MSGTRNLIFTTLLLVALTLGMGLGIPNAHALTSSVTSAVIDGFQTKAISIATDADKAGGSDTYITKTAYIGDADIQLMVLRQVNKTYDCYCKSDQGVMVNCLSKCTESQNVLVPVTKDTLLLKNDVVYEVFKGCTKYSFGQKYLCSVWTDLKVQGIDILGATWWNVTSAWSSVTNNTNTTTGNRINYGALWTTSAGSYGATLQVTNCSNTTNNWGGGTEAPSKACDGDWTTETSTGARGARNDSIIFNITQAGTDMGTLGGVKMNLKFYHGNDLGIVVNYYNYDASAYNVMVVYPASSGCNCAKNYTLINTSAEISGAFKTGQPFKYRIDLVQTNDNGQMYGSEVSFLSPSAIYAWNSSSINGSAYVNGSASLITNWANFSFLFPNATGSNITVKIYANDTSGENVTGIWFWNNMTPVVIPPLIPLNFTPSSRTFCLDNTTLIKTKIIWNSSVMTNTTEPVYCDYGCFNASCGPAPFFSYLGFFAVLIGYSGFVFFLRWMNWKTGGGLWLVFLIVWIGVFLGFGVLSGYLYPYVPAQIQPYYQLIALALIFLGVFATLLV